MAETSVELDFPAILNGGQYVGFPYYGGPSLTCGGCRRGVRGSDHADTEGGLDGMR